MNSVLVAQASSLCAWFVSKNHRLEACATEEVDSKACPGVELLEFVRRSRTDDTHFDVVQFGTTSGISEQDRKIVTPYARAGATWWVESIAPAGQSLAQVRSRIRQGPPTLDGIPS